MKRRYSDELPEPPTKRPRSYVTSEGYEIEIERGGGTPDLGDLVPQQSPHKYQQPGVSKWNQCSYRCGICAKTSNSRNSINSHITNDHGLSSKEYKESYPNIEVIAHHFHVLL